MKSSTVASILWALGIIGLCGLHRIYLNKKESGLVYLFTFGLFSVGQFCDFFALGSLVAEANEELSQNTHQKEKKKVINNVLMSSDGITHDKYNQRLRK